MNRALRAILIAALAGSLALPAAGVSAPLSKRIDRARAKIDHKRAREGVLTEAISGYNNRVNALQGDIRSLQAREGRIQGRLDRTQAELDGLRVRLQAARDRLAILRAELRRAERALAARLVELYKADEPDTLTVVLESDGFADLLERTEFLELVSEQDREIVGRVRRLKAEARALTARLAVLEARTEVAANAIRARRDELNAARMRRVRSRDVLMRVRLNRRVALRRVRSSRSRLEGDLRAMEREQARVRARLAQAEGALGDAPVRRGSGRLIWPVNGSITSGFGMRWGRLHAGIDIPAAAGTPIRAADSGTVTLMGPTGGYGNYTCVRHTASLTTCYAHQLRFGTRRGASVRQGEVIGYVGNTGHSFGNHLHFETRVGGNPVDPMGYL